MSKYNTYLRLQPYLEQWLLHESGSNPVIFRKGSPENNIMELFVRSLPLGVEPDLPGEGLTAIKIPTFHGKNEDTYNYLPPRAKQALKRCIYIRFRVQLWEEVHTVDNINGCLTDIIYAWLEKHGIEQTEQNWETIRQMYFRMRAIYRDKKTKKSD